MKLIIQIPCYNEEKTLPVILQELPRQLEGFSSVEWLLIDDGSTDRSVEIAYRYGIDHVLRLNGRKGLSKVFLRGIDASVKLGADVVVNIDADNQYNAHDIPKLVKPILDKRAEFVIGARPIETIESFSPVKKILQRLGSWTIRRLSYTRVPDAPSGFRAITREAAMKLNVFNTYTYTLETLIQAGNKNLSIEFIPIRVNKELRPSRLVKSIWAYTYNSFVTIVRIFVVYRPFKTFMLTGMIIFSAGILLGLRYLYFYATGHGVGHIQSVILSGVLLGFGFQTMIVAFLADLLAVNRTLLEDVQNRVKHIELDRRHETVGNHEKITRILHTESIHDPLTGAYNRQYFNEWLSSKKSMNPNSSVPLGIIMLALRHKNTFTGQSQENNREYTLRELGVLFKQLIREDDLLCRYDNEQFLFLLYDVSLEITKDRAEQLLERIHQIYETDHTEAPLTISLGIAVFPTHGNQLDTAIQAAEHACAQARNTRDGSIVIASP